MQSQGVEQLSVFEVHLLTESPGFLFLLSVCSGHLFFPGRGRGQEGAGTCRSAVDALQMVTNRAFRLSLD
jgi:hypothetical protein